MKLRTSSGMHQQPRLRRIHIPLLCPFFDAVPVHTLVLMIDRRWKKYIRMPPHDTDRHIRVTRQRVVQVV